MYDKCLVGLGTSAAAGTLANPAADMMWYGLGGFALVAASLAVLRIIPRKQA